MTRLQLQVMDDDIVVAMSGGDILEACHVTTHSSRIRRHCRARGSDGVCTHIKRTSTAQRGTSLRLNKVRVPAPMR